MGGKDKMLDSGVIIMWSGNIVNIPAGFVLCDGTNGTPDLLDRFIVGAGDSFAVDDTGGTSVHTHDFSADPHNHIIESGTPLGGGPTFAAITTNTVAVGTTDNGVNVPLYHALAFIMKT